MNSFTIDKNNFMLNGESIQLISGAIHYFRIHPDLWEDRISKMKLLGLNCLELYVAWNIHEENEGKFNYTGIADLEKFIKIAQDYELLVIVRPGPYICAEWEFGGLPAWLLKNSDIKLRCYNKPYLEKVDNFFDSLVPRISRLQIDKGGPVIAVQVENEYGSYGNDKKYLRYLADGLKKRGITVPLFTSDGDEDFMLQYGTLPDVLKTVNFGSKSERAFKQLRKYQKEGPLMCMEFWNGWFDHWGEEHHGGDYLQCVKNLEEILEAQNSVNFYMIHGGTNFGFYSGANHNTDNYEPTVTSYDYDAAISECGDITPKFREFRKVLEKYLDLPEFVEPENSKKIAIPPFKMNESTSLFESLHLLSNKIESSSILSMEQVGQNYGFIKYKTTVPGPRKDNLEIRGLHDRAMVFIDGILTKILYRNDSEKKIPLDITDQGATIEILVENMGRVNYGSHLFDRKGVTGDVVLGWQVLNNWEIFPIPLNNIDKLEFYKTETVTDKPCFYKGDFYIDEVGDTFLSLPAWTKCICWINGYNIGRYWNVGPQKTLYVPAPILKEGDNEIIIFELHPNGNTEVEFLNSPNLG